MAKRALAVDLGSSSVRAIVFETAGAGELVAVEGALAKRPRHLTSDEPGQATFDAEDYLADLVSCIDELHDRGDLEGVEEVAMDCQWHSVMAVGRDGGPVSDVVSWADTRPDRPLPGTPSDVLEELRQRTGCAFSPMYWTWRVPWLRAVSTGAQPHRFLGFSEYVGLKLLDDPSMSVSMASGTGLLATVARDWDDQALELASAGRGALAPLAKPGWRGELGSQWRRRWPALADAPWHPALGDGAAANLGVGCDRPDQAAMTVGTSAAVRSVRRGPDTSRLPTGLWRYCVDDERTVTGAAFSSGGQLYRWALSLWEGGSFSAPEEDGTGSDPLGLSASVRYDVSVPVPAGSDGVLVLPWHAGTRPPAPGVPAGRGAVVGLGLGHGGAHIVSAAVEAVCFQLAGGLSDLESSAGPEPAPATSLTGREPRQVPAKVPVEVVVNGGAVEGSRWWKQRLAAALARPVLCSSVPETTARGAAADALRVELGARGIEGEIVEPVPADVETMAAARRLWSEYYEVLLPIVTRRSL
jgi:gluconokinase